MSDDALDRIGEELNALGVTEGAAITRKSIQNQIEPPVYAPARLLSFAISKVLVRTAVTPNTVSLLWGACLVGSALLLAQGEPAKNLIAASLIAAAYVLDCVDGELARLRAQPSRVGSMLEQMVHWVTNSIVLAGVGVGLYRMSGDQAYLFVCIVALIGDTTFHFMYVTLGVAASPGGSHVVFAWLTRMQFRLMPINTNLVMIGALVGQLGVALWTWAIWSNLAWLIGFVLFFYAERQYEQDMRFIQQTLNSAGDSHIGPETI